MKIVVHPAPEAFEELPLEITISMPIREWRRVQKQLGGDYPSWTLKDQIRQALEKVFGDLVFEADA